MQFSILCHYAKLGEHPRTPITPPKQEDNVQAQFEDAAPPPAPPPLPAERMW